MRVPYENSAPEVSFYFYPIERTRMGLKICESYLKKLYGSSNAGAEATGHHMGSMPPAGLRTTMSIFLFP
jgi:hypothetical protein